MSAESDPAPNSDDRQAQGSDNENEKAVGGPPDARRGAEENDAPSPNARMLRRLELAPWPGMAEPPPRERAETPEKRRFFGFEDPIGLVAGLATLGLLGVGGLSLHDHIAQSEFTAAKSREIALITRELEKLESQTEAIDAARAREAAAKIEKLLGEVKAEAAASHDFTGQLTQLGQRLDRLEKDQSARLDKLGERFDHEITPRFAELALRMDKLDKRIVAAAPAVEPPARPNLTPPAPAIVANDVTGSIQKPKSNAVPMLRDYSLEDIRNGMALIDGRDGPYTVGPGDLIPGAGRVLKIERRGRDWVVVTSIGIIGAPPE